MNICLRIVTERIQPGDELALFCQLRMAVVCMETCMYSDSKNG